jgi:hypothetical protein
MFQTLQKCHEYRVNIYSYIYNSLVFIVFFSLFGIVLYYRYKNKPTPEELRIKMEREQNYILSKIRYYQNEKDRATTSSITDLPFTYNPNTVDFV